MRPFFDRELETAATFWRIYRRDGLALGFTSHDRDLAFRGILHRAAPGMVPAAIKLNADLSQDSAEVEGALSHGSIREEDLSAGLFDNASIEIGIVDWRTRDWRTLYSGQLGRIENDRQSFSAELKSAKHILERDIVPRTSPTCRALFCGPGCGLSSSRFTSVRRLEEIDVDQGRVRFAAIAPEHYIDGRIRFLAGPQTGLPFGVIGSHGQWLVLDRPLVEGIEEGTRTELIEGCDHTLATCSARFANARNFRGEPFLPGNDLLARYGSGSA